MRSPILLFLFLIALLPVSAQVTVNVRVNSGTSGSTCTDGAFGGAPEYQWRVNIANQGYVVYPQDGACFNSFPNVQYSETFGCASSVPYSLSVCFQAFENDGNVCVANPSCLVTRCQGLVVPAVGSSNTVTVSIPNNGTNASWGSVSLTIWVTGSFPPGASYDQICNAINLGTLNSGASLGNSNLSTYGNFCANAVGEPSPWGGGNDQGVWFRFTTGSSVGSVITIDLNNDPSNVGDQIDLQVALYRSSNNLCSGTLTLIDADHDGIGVTFDEEMAVNCLEPFTTYFILVDGEESTLPSGGQEGYFGISLSDDGIVQGGDEICDAENLGLVPDGGSVSTGGVNQSNVCASDVNDPTPSNWPSDNGVWYSFFTPSSGSVVITANSDLPFPVGTDAIDIELALYSSSTGLCTDPLTEVASSYVSGAFDETLSSTCLTPGLRHFVFVDGSASDGSGIFGLTIADLNSPVASNNAICDAKSLGNPWSAAASLTGENNYCADNTGDPAPASFTTNQTVWYSFETPASGGPHALDISASSGGDPIDLELALFESSTNTCGGVLNEVVSAYVTGTFDEQMNAPCLLDGSTYFLMVDGSAINTEGQFDIGLTSAAVGAGCFLPIELIHFSAKAEGQEARLTWETATELNNDYFTLKRSLDGEVFETIATIAGGGTTQFNSVYEFVDRNPSLGVNYYELWQTDIDGSTKRVGTSALDFAPQSSGIQVVPNPAKDRVHLFVDASVSGDARVQVYSTDGKCVFERSRELGAGKNEVSLDIQFLAPGVYRVNVTTDQNAYSSQFVKQ